MNWSDFIWGCIAGGILVGILIIVFVKYQLRKFGRQL